MIMSLPIRMKIFCYLALYLQLISCKANYQQEMLTAIYQKDLEAFNALIEEYPEFIDEPIDSSNNTVVHMAVKAECMPILTRLAALGARCNVVNKSGLSPLHLAVFLGNKSMVCLLLQKGVTANRVVKDGLLAGCTALDISLDHTTGSAEEMQGINQVLLSYGAKRALQIIKNPQPAVRYLQKIRARFSLPAER